MKRLRAPSDVGNQLGKLSGPERYGMGMMLQCVAISRMKFPTEIGKLMCQFRVDT